MTPTDLLQRHNISVAGPDDPHYRLGWTNTKCPFCHGHKNHLGIKNDFSRANCYKCGKKDVLYALRLLTRENLDELKQIRAFATPDRSESVARYGKYTPVSGLVALSQRDRAYLHDRGLDADGSVERYKLRSIGPFSGVPKGIFIPITFNWEPVSWTIRFREAVDGQRYKTASDSQKSMSEKDILFGAETCTNTIIVVEGFFDMANIGDGAVCTFGLAYTQKQVQLMAGYPRRVICFDNSRDAQQVAARLASDLAVFPGETLQVTLDADDPGSASREEVQELRKFAGLDQ
jgi:hypothetical protein